MGQAGRALVEEIAVEELIDKLDRLQAYELVVGEWARAMGLRLSGPALFLLADELAAVAASARSHADALAARVVVLGGEPTTDPGQWVARAGVDRFELVDASAIEPVLRYALGRVRELIAEYGRLARELIGRDEVTRKLVVSALGEYVQREDEIEGALGAPPTAAARAT